MQDDQTHSEPWHIQNSLFKRFQGYLDKFKDLDASMARNQGGQERSLLSVLKIEIHSTCSFRVSTKKIQIFFPAGSLFLVFFDEMFTESRKCPSSTILSLSPTILKSLWLRTCTEALFFLQNAASQIIENVLNTSVSVTAE